MSVRGGVRARTVGRCELVASPEPESDPDAEGDPEPESELGAKADPEPDAGPEAELDPVRVSDLAAELEADAFVDRAGSEAARGRRA